MLKSLELHNFRKHEHANVAFAEGLNTIRGANEDGKTTLAEAIGYCLFGSRSLRTSLEDCVTWGKRPGDLKASLVIEVDGQDYSFVRSRSGAEVLKSGEVLVTGQNEVSAFAANLLGGDAKVASYLMFATQGDLRGVLTEGPKATTQLLEELADMTIFDRILDLAQTKLAMGTTAVLDERLAGLKASIAAYVAPEKPDEAAHHASLAKLNKAVDDADKMLSPLEKELADLTPKFKAEQDKRLQAVEINNGFERLAAQRQETLIQRSAEAAIAAQPVDDPAPIQAQLEQAKMAKEIESAIAVFHTIPAVLGENRAEFMVKKSAAESSERDLAMRISGAESSIRTLNSQLVRDMTCPTCGQAIANVEQVKAKNEQIEAEIAAVNSSIERMKSERSTILDALDGMKRVMAEDDRVNTLSSKISRFVEVDSSVIPSAVSLASGVATIEVRLDISELEGKIRAISDAASRRMRAQAKVEALDDVLARIDKEDMALKARLADLNPMSDERFKSLEIGFSSLAERVEKAKWDFSCAQGAANELNAKYISALSAWEQSKLQIQNLQGQVLQTQSEIETINFNNTLMKKIRAARPLVGNKLWQMVLSSVSTIFSAIRGEPSVVSRDKDGFTVNGQSVECLSGSTLDILGLAIRVALVKTFLPSANMLILDEAAAAMDSDRTLSFLAYIASCGFKQTVLITHESVSEDFAANIINLNGK